MVILCHCSLTFEDLNVNFWLIIYSCGEDLGLFTWDCGVPRDQSSHDFTCSLDALAQWSYIDKNHLVRGFTSFS